jgi:Tol biopolymer transport system component/DNA-binding winged helix-turn-helix (wHTH) protein/predicted Ser/Thr protein kinase
MAATGAVRPIRFGAFAFDSSSRELRKGGTWLRVPEQSLAILAMLLDRPGEVVTREEIQARLWPHGTIVEFEHSVNSAVKRLREALSDTASTPRYIETLPRKGYRFIGQLETDTPEAGTLVPGAVVSHYRIVAEAGRGAMGVVYKAEDLTLGRTVALKFLPEELAAHPPALERMRREARMIGALNHPGICTLYELGEASGRVFLAMEFLEGEPLRARMTRGPVSEAEFFDIALQVARALEAAHGQGIVHRDIKPDNLFVTKSGQVKVMDFGLAKTVSQEDGVVAQSTVTGTSGYMSPEQARGEPLDARSDIYSFGRVLSELAGGRLASRVAPVIAKAMASDPAGRWQSATELRTALEKIPRQASRKRWRRALLAAALLACAVTVVVWTKTGRPPAEMNPVSLISTAGWANTPAFSSDGSRVAYQWTASLEASYNSNDDPSGIYVKQIGGGPSVRLTRGHMDIFPAWSPDDRYIAFYRATEETILLVPSIGGPERRIAKAEVPHDQTGVAGIFWTLDGKWLVVSTRDSPNEPYGIWLLSAETGERHRLLPPPAAVLRQGGIAQGDFIGGLSPDGRVLAFARTVREWVIHLYTVRLTRDFKPEGTPHLLVDKGYGSFKGMTWTSNRDIVYSVGLPSDARLWRMRVGAGFPERLNWAAPGACLPATAPAQHRLAYTAFSFTGKLWRMDLRTGERRTIVGSRYEEDFPQYSPDGRKVAFQSDRSGNFEVWTCDADGTNCQQLTFFEGPQGGTPRWSPDGRWIALDSRAEGTAQIYVISSDGGKPRRVTGGDAQSQVPSWSRDGRWIYFQSDRSGQWCIWKVPPEGGSAVQVTKNTGGAAFESVDGKYLYITSNGNNGGPLYRMPVAGGPEVEVAPKVVYWDCFSVTAKGVYFLPDLKTLQLLDAATGKIKTVATTDKPSFGLGGISVSPDGAYMVYSEWELGGSDIMLVENFR